MDDYTAFRLNNSFAQLLRISDVYEFLPEELAAFLTGQQSQNISGGSGGAGGAG